MLALFGEAFEDRTHTMTRVADDAGARGGGDQGVDRDRLPRGAVSSRAPFEAFAEPLDSRDIARR